VRERERERERVREREREMRASAQSLILQGSDESIEEEILVARRRM
jgi:hypothetical protein